MFASCCVLILFFLSFIGKEKIATDLFGSFPFKEEFFMIRKPLLIVIHLSENTLVISWLSVLL
jgi:hypothetical protein